MANKKNFILCGLFVFLLAGCSLLASSGPTRVTVENRAAPEASGIQIVDVNDNVTHQLVAINKAKLFSEVFKNKNHYAYGVGPGDVLEFAIWEVPPGTLFASATTDSQMEQNSRVTNFPAQMVSSNGTINIPYAGQIKVAGLDTQQIQNRIVKRLQGKANQPQALVKVVQNTNATVTIVGEVATSKQMPLTPRGERLLDAMASAGGVKASISKVSVQLTRNNDVYALPLDTVIRDPKQNIVLQPGDVVTALYQPLSFTVLGATGKNEEINFESQGITLAQALARAGGLQNDRADPQGVFIFRFESKTALNSWPKQPVMTTPEGKVPVIYRVDLRDPKTFFLAQNFPIYNKDILYIANAPLIELQKFLNIVLSVMAPTQYIANTVH